MMNMRGQKNNAIYYIVYPNIYACYSNSDGSFTGDPAHIELTQICEKFGWTGQGTAFDILPLIIEAENSKPKLYEIPQDAILEVPITHPEYPWFADFGLRWHAVPLQVCKLI